MNEKREVRGYNTTILNKYDLLIDWCYPLMCDRDQWNFTLAQIRKYGIPYRWFYTFLYLIASYHKEIVETCQLEHDLIIESWDQDRHNKKLKLKKALQKLIKAEPPHYFFLDREISVKLIVNGRTIDPGIRPPDLVKWLTKEILSYEGQIKTKKRTKTTSAIELLTGFARMMHGEKLCKTERIYEFMEEVLCFYGFSFETYKDPRSFIKKYLKITTGTNPKAK